MSAALATLFVLAERTPWLLRLLRPIAIRATVMASAQVRHATTANAARLSPPSQPIEPQSFARRVVGEFYDAVIDIGRSRSSTVETLRSRIRGTEGEPAYHAARTHGKGAVLVTAHMGSFEVGLAALSQFESNIHVVFKRDPFPAFERIRAALRARIGVREAAIDDGWRTLMQLRAALEANEVVVLQADRAMPGQRWHRVPIAGGHLDLPVGPVTLARIVGSPIVPVFCVRDGSGFRIHLLDPIWLTDLADADADADAMHKIGRAIETFITRHPDQWLVLDPAFVEDRPAGDGAHPEKRR